VYSLPLTTGNIGTLAFEYSISLYKESAQKCGGVQTKIIVNNMTGYKVRFPVAQAHPIIGGKAPAAPPITILCGVFRLSQIV
tara:strand:- start:22 stop:267 length:246 start_codon:yes stop_codon:yes gene_type:complete